MVPRGPEALQKAKDENKLILVSIGYSACHWCHVMEHESFENEAVAGWVNSPNNSPRLRYAGRPSLLRKEGEEKMESLFLRSEERVVERSNDRVSKQPK